MRTLDTNPAPSPHPGGETEFVWSTVPSADEPAGSRPLPLPLATALTAVAASLGPALHVAVVLDPLAGLATAAIAVVAVVLLSRLMRTAYISRLAIVVTAVLVTSMSAGRGHELVSFVGRGVGVWVGLGLLASSWALLDRPPLPGLRPAGRQTLPGFAILTAMAAVVGAREVGTFRPAILTAAALLVAAVGSRFGPQVGAMLKSVGLFAGNAVSRVLFTILAVPAIVVPWIGSRLVGYDNLRTPTVDGTQWVPRHQLRPDPKQAWGRDPAVTRHPVGHRIRRRLVLPAFLVVNVLVVGGVVELIAPAVFAEPDPVPAAFAGDKWWPGYWHDLEFTLAPPVWNPYRRQPVQDVATNTINVTNGIRRSWHPPPCGCSRLAVWMYGGSTTFGVGQRDDHTVPSELAKRAWEDGIALDIVNRGVPGELLWQETQRFGWDAFGDRPDLVIFYDGANDVGRAFPESVAADQVDETPLSPGIEELASAYQDDSRPSFAILDVPDGARLLPRRQLVTLDPIDGATHSMSRYERSRQASETIARGAEVPVRWFWQPTQFTRPISNEPHNSPDADRETRELHEHARSLLSPKVTDLADVLDDYSDPMFWDGVHTNETAAAIVADAIYDSLQSDLAALASGQQ